MSVLIKGMEMPHSCVGCRFCEHGSINEWDLYCGIDNKHIGNWDDKHINNGWRRPDCLLVEVPTPHGHLIDADALHKATYHRAFETDGDTKWQSGCWVRYRAIEQVQDSQPTIIEAEEGEE